MLEHGRTLGRPLDNGLSGHAPGLCGKVDALAGALCDIACSVANQRDAALAAAWPRVLRNGVRLDANDFAALGLDLQQAPTLESPLYALLPCTTSTILMLQWTWC